MLDIPRHPINDIEPASRTEFAGFEGKDAFNDVDRLRRASLRSRNRNYSIWGKFPKWEENESPSSDRPLPPVVVSTTLVVLCVIVRTTVVGVGGGCLPLCTKVYLCVPLWWLCVGCVPLWWLCVPLWLCCGNVAMCGALGCAYHHCGGCELCTTTIAILCRYSVTPRDRQPPFANFFTTPNNLQSLEILWTQGPPHNRWLADLVRFLIGFIASIYISILNSEHYATYMIL